MSRTPSPAVLAAITACVVLAGVGAGIVFRPTQAPPGATVEGPRATIALVAPREPVPEPGSRMDVGDLADGYVHRDHGPPADLPDIAGNHAPSARASTPPAGGGRDMAPDLEPPPVVAERGERTRRWAPYADSRNVYADRRERRDRSDDGRRWDDARSRDRLDHRDDPPAWRDDRRRDAWPERDRRPYRDRRPGPELDPYY